MGNNLSRAKAIVCYVGVMALGLTEQMIPEKLGTSHSAVSQSSKRVLQIVTELGLTLNEFNARNWGHLN